MNTQTHTDSVPLLQDKSLPTPAATSV